MTTHTFESKEKFMKTALQQLIEKLIEQKNNKTFKDSPRLKEGIDISIVIAQALLEEERRQIVEAYSEGYGNGSMRSKKDGEEYFNKTFNPNQ